MKHITKKNGTVFPTKRSAQGRAGFLKLKEGEYEIVAKEFGYVIQVIDEVHDRITAEITDKNDRSKPKVKEPESVLDETDNAAEEIIEEPKEPAEELKKTVEFSGNWKPARLLSTIDKYRKPGFKYKWVNTSMEGNVEKKLSEGWEIDKEIYKHAKHLNAYKDNTTSLDTTTRIRELLLMRIPEKIAEQRNKYFRDMANKRITQEQNRLEGELQEGGGSMYGGMKIHRGR